MPKISVSNPVQNFENYFLNKIYMIRTLIEYIQ